MTSLSDSMKSWKPCLVELGLKADSLRGLEFPTAESKKMEEEVVSGHVYEVTSKHIVSKELCDGLDFDPRPLYPFNIEVGM
ncbi:hypothetical protein RJ641_007110 [Dillenia turbinata]|uniref:Uncharacterized protein n=1 Tax=Dillenia turbinata TaxID=194707 RepID=A0AAN8VBJ5_9MAGN